jgi:hypothetical protein
MAYNDKRIAHEHFALRVRERIGSDVDPHDLFRRIIASVEDADDWCRYVMRQPASETGLRRVYRFIWDDGEEYFVVLEKCFGLWIPLTILPRENKVLRLPKGKVKVLYGEKRKPAPKVWDTWFRGKRGPVRNR